SASRHAAKSDSGARPQNAVRPGHFRRCARSALVAGPFDPLRCEMGTRRRTFVRSEDGSVILETALMLTVLLILMFGMVDFGRVLSPSNNLIAAAREGARFGAVQNVPGVGGTTGIAAIKTVVKNRFNQYTFGGDNLVDGNIDIDTGGVAGVGATYVKVSIKY